MSQIRQDEILLLLSRGRELEKSNPPKAAIAVEEAFRAAINSDNLNLATNCGNTLANIYLSLNEINKCLKILQQTVSCYEKLKDWNNVISCYERCAGIHLSHHDNTSALEILLRCCSIYREQQNPLKLAETFNRIGDIYKLIAEYNTAITYHQKALPVFEQMNDEEQICITQFYIGNCYNWADELDVAYNYLSTSLKIAEKLRKPELKIRTLGSLAILFTKYKDFEKSQSYFFEAIDNAKLTGNNKIKADLLKSLGNLYNQQKEFDKAISTLNEGLDITDNLNLKFPANLIHLFLSDAWKAKGVYDKALEHYRIYHELSREIQNEEVNLRSRGLELKYDLEEIKKEKQAAEKNIILKDKFLAGMTHELRTPLNGIVGMTDVLADTILSQDQKEYVETIRNSAFNIVTIINDLLEYARLNTGQIKSEETTFNLQHFIEILIKEFADKKITVALSTSLNLKLNLTSDKNIIHKILGHVINYSSQKNTTDSITLECSFSTGKKVPYLDFKILFSPKSKSINADSVFDIQVDEKYITGAITGTGLGLNISKQLATLLNGIISFNQSNKVSFFELHVPVKLAEKTIALHDAGIKVPASVKEKIIKILLVEDNKINQFLAKTMLTKNGFLVEVAVDGNEALQKLQNGNFDIVLTDVQMPGMNGYELATHIRTKLKKPLCDIPLIALTAYESDIEKEKARQSGMTDFLTKPYNPQDLLAVIQKHKHVYDNFEPEASEEKEEIISIDNTITHLGKLMHNSPSDLQNLIRMITEQIPQLNSEIEKAIKKQDWDATYKAAHKLKSSINILQVKTLNEEIEMIESNAMKKINLESIPRIFQQFRNNCVQIVLLLKSKIVQ